MAAAPAARAARAVVDFFMADLRLLWGEEA
jgi:hypothetical protein